MTISVKEPSLACSVNACAAVCLVDLDLESLVVDGVLLAVDRDFLSGVRNVAEVAAVNVSGHTGDECGKNQSKS